MTIYTEPKTPTWTPERRAAASLRLKMRWETGDDRTGRKPGVKNKKPPKPPNPKKGRQPMTEEHKEKVRANILTWNKSEEARKLNSERVKSNPIPGGGRKKGGKNSKPLPRESYLHLKPPYPTQATKDKLALAAINRTPKDGQIGKFMAYRGKFRPNHPEKYDGDPTNIVYRSSLELRFMQHLDSNANVLKWQSEEFFIPYFDGATNRHRRYFVDFLVVVKHGNGTLTQLIEIKPANQCVPPKVPAKRTRRSLNEQLTWVTNNCKWQAAREYAADRNWVFKIITDKDLGMLPK